MTASRVVPLAVLLVAVAGCTGGTSPGSTSPTASDSAADATTSPSATPPPPAPRPAACYRFSAAALTRPTTDAEPVPCRSRHNARTIHVGRLDTVVQGHAVAVDSARVQRQLATTCPRKLAAYVGGTQRDRDLSRFDVVWWSPTIAQSDLGADWFRCDLVAFGAGEQLFDLPGKGLEGVLDTPDGLATYGLCGTAEPGAPGFDRVICARPHRWRAFDTLPLGGGRRYPGVAVVREAGDRRCLARAQARVRAAGGDTLRVRYGWEWPTREQWLAGQRFGYCWAPD